MYPRLIRLRDGRILLSVATSSGKGITDMARIYESSDEGRTFRQLSEIRDPAASQGRGGCCGSLLELPGPSGALLWAGVAGMKNRAPGRRAELRVWRSRDGGRNWAYLSSCAIAPDGTPWNRGFWEPELTVDAQGRLVCYYADETEPGHDQVISAAFSTDGGVSWGSRTVIVAPGRHDRPGMPVVRRLPDGSYLMVYELCGPSEGAACAVHQRRSADGSTWGDAAGRGGVVRTVDGGYLHHAPTLAWAPGGGPAGRILLVGGLLRDARGRLARPASGATVLMSTDGGQGRWFQHPAPVRVSFSKRPDHFEVVCTNYSSTLLPLSDGAGLLEVATKRSKDGRCQAHVSSAPLPLSATPDRTRS